MSKETDLSRAEIEEIIMTTLVMLFDARKRSFDRSHPIEHQVEDFDYDTLENALREHKGFNHVRLNPCDSVNDIISSNFKI